MKILPKKYWKVLQWRNKQKSVNACFLDKKAFNIYQKITRLFDRLSGDLFISLDTIRTNAEQFGASYEDELHRVVIHGILHLCGINDKGPGEREVMEAAENKACLLYTSRCV